MNNLKHFIGKQQLAIVREVLQGEEGAWFAGKMAELETLFDTMPKTYEQDGKGDQATAYLHYFKGGMNWYITERDMETEQLQAFGLANLGYGAELGYISIKELIENDVELEFHFKPLTLAYLKLAA